MKKKSEKRRPSMFWSLVGQYVLFTLAVVAVSYLIVKGISSYHAENSRQNSYSIVSTDFLAALQRGDYAQIDAEQYLGSEGWFEVYDAEATLLYASDGVPSDLSYSAQDLACIPGDDWTTIRVLSYQDDAQREIEEFVKYRLEGENFVETGIFQIDGQTGEIIYANTAVPGNLTSYSERQLSLLEGLDGDYALTCLDFQNAQGEELTALAGEYLYSSLPESLASDKTVRMAAVLVLAGYVLLIVLFVSWLSHWFRKPVKMLSGAMTEMSEGERGVVLEYQGPQEFTAMVDSFNTMSRRLDEAEKEREQAHQEQQKMLADISHDLKTPITVIQGYANAVSDGMVKEEDVPKVLRTIARKSDQLAGLVDAFHTFSKMDHPDFALQMEKVDLAETVREYLAGRYEEMELGGYALEADLPEEPLYCEVDVVNFTRVIENLLNNSMRHNKPGTTLLVAMQKENREIVLRVGDNGTGISPEQARHIFEPFYTGEQARTHGSGLGLSIARRIVQLHGGAICLLPAEEPWHVLFEIRLPAAE
jgi:signal transduction histidine kinase